MNGEAAFIDMLRAIAGHPAARGLMDDAAVLEVGGEALVLTHDMMVEGVHFLPAQDPADVAWKLVTRNLSDLAAKGAEPLTLSFAPAQSPVSPCSSTVSPPSRTIPLRDVSGLNMA